MKRQLLMHVVMAVLVAGLLTMVACSKPKVADPGTHESGTNRGDGCAKSCPS